MMKYILQNSDVLLVEHDGKTIEWNIQGFNRTSISNGQSEFDHVNDYIAYLGDDWQCKFFKIMRDIDDVLNSFGQFEAKHGKLVDLVGEAMDTINPHQTVVWVDQESSIRMATNLKEDYTEADKDPNKTFLRDEYEDVLVLAMWMKLLVGVFGSYLELNKKKLGSFKEHMALRLLDKSWVMKSTQVERLLRYIDAWIRQSGKTDRADVGGLSNYELPMYILAHILIRKLATGNLEDNLGNGGVIVSLHRGVQSALGELKRHFTVIKDKTEHIKDLKTGEDKNNYSKAELYMITQTIRSGDVAIYKHFIRHILENTHHIDDTLPQEELEQCIVLVPKLMLYPISEHTVIMTQWVLQQLIPARMIYNLNKDELLCLTVMTQALLWHWGFKDLAVILTAKVDSSSLIAGVESPRSNKRVKTELMQELETLYPHTRPNLSTKTRDYNLAHKAITMVKDLLTGCWLTPIVPEYMIDYSDGLCVNKRGIVLPDDLPTQLAELLIKVGK